MKLPGPDHPITITSHGKHVRVAFAGRVVADTTRALTLKEAGYKPVLYIPRADADMSLLTRTSHSTHCPYKGDASYFSIVADERTPRTRCGATRALSRQWPRSRNISRFFPTGLIRSRKLEQVCSVQPRTLEEFCAVRRVHTHVECDAFTIKRKRHFDAGASERPNLAVKAGECRYAVTLDRHDDVTRLDFGARGRPFRRNADHNDLVLDLG